MLTSTTNLILSTINDSINEYEKGKCADFNLFLKHYKISFLLTGLIWNKSLEHLKFQTIMLSSTNESDYYHLCSKYNHLIYANYIKRN